MKYTTKMNPRTHDSLQDTLSFFGVDCHRPYYISSGNPLFEYPSNSFRMDFYALCICTAGTIHVEIDNHTYTLSQDSLLISAPSTIIKFTEVSKDFRMKLLFFDKLFLLKNIANPFFMEKIGLFNKTSYAVLPAAKNLVLKLLKLLDYLSEVTLRTTRFTPDIIRTIIFNMLLEIADVLAAEDRQRVENIQETNSLYFKFTELVQQHCHQCKDVKYYADRLFISNKYLISIVKKASGKTPHEIIDENLLKEAYVLLGNPERSISDIAYAIGFNSISAFGRFFKKYAMLTPSEYRNRQNM